ncbi:SpoIVB peptidase [Thalassobacillus sp. C254]|uniref:SpoIVB peptidase n=1 Tax=Thalassobacillus sp. C254 TaxID=1225341 RepID=UPI0006D19CF5|nr:SpoIVB peptidase [Thalassobacillus sp. C254]
MNYQLTRRMIGILLLILLIGIGVNESVQKYIQLPDSLFIYEKEFSEAGGPVQAALKQLDLEGLSLEVTEDDLTTAGESVPLTITAASFPVKKVDVRVIPDIEVVPGGQSIGVKLNSEGVMVVGHHQIPTGKGKISPGKEAGIEVGDVIKKINDKTVQHMGEVADAVQKAADDKQEIFLTIKRGQETIEKKMKVVKDEEGEGYRMGLYVRDSAAGVGTMTFYEPESGKYGALGHVISDTDTKKPIVVHDGEIVRSSVTSIEKGANGDPGEKLARMTEDRKILGNINKNSSFGIFGVLNNDHQLKNNVMDESLPVAFAEEIKEGPAEILTVVEGEKVEKFGIEVVKSFPQSHPATKGMVIKVTDPKLLEKTGGIVQGMSGSPIIQNGKIIGAVTHVFVNDATSGYACHIEWMLEEAGVETHIEKRKAS